jgi:hypothetical protein
VPSNSTAELDVCSIPEGRPPLLNSRLRNVSAPEPPSASHRNDVEVLSPLCAELPVDDERSQSEPAPERPAQAANPPAQARATGEAAATETAAAEASDNPLAEHPNPEPAGGRCAAAGIETAPGDASENGAALEAAGYAAGLSSMVTEKSAQQEAGVQGNRETRENGVVLLRSAQAPEHAPASATETAVASQRANGIVTATDTNGQGAEPRLAQGVDAGAAADAVTPAAGPSDQTLAPRQPNDLTGNGDAVAPKQLPQAAQALASVLALPRNGIVGATGQPSVFLQGFMRDLAAHVAKLPPHGAVFAALPAVAVAAAGGTPPTAAAAPPQPQQPGNGAASASDLKQHEQPSTSNNPEQASDGLLQSQRPGQPPAAAQPGLEGASITPDEAASPVQQHLSLEGEV